MFLYLTLSPLSLSKQLLKIEFVLTSIRATASLGTFEILTKKLRNSNGGKPLPLYQVACCGFISGSTAALLWTPPESAVNKVGLTNLTYSNWLTTLRHRQSAVNKVGLTNLTYTNWLTALRHTRLWRADTVALLTPRIAAYVGMLTSYDWSRTYFIAKQGLRKLEAETYSSFVAGFFTAACSHPFLYAVAIANAMKTRKLARSRIVPLISFYLTPYSGSMFYTHFLTKFHYAAFAWYNTPFLNHSIDWN